ncbi:MAG: ABC transporter permease [Verrucomicrobiota bacterium]
MLFSPFIAARYLKPKRLYLSIITVISVIGVSLAVWLLGVVIAVFTGYGERIKESILGFEPHLIVDSGGIVDDFLPVIESIMEVDGVESITPYVRGQVVMDYSGLRSAPVIRGIVPPEGEELERMRAKLATTPDPQYPDDPDKAIPRVDFDLTDYYSAVVGDGIANAQNIAVGDKLLLYSPRDVHSVMERLDRVAEAETDDERNQVLDDVREMTAPQEVTVTGIFDSGHWDFDSNIIFTHLETAQILYNFDLEECHGIAIRTDDAFKATEYQGVLYETLPQQFRVVTWGQMHKMMFDAVAGERQMMYLILFMIVIVASFCTMNTMITVTFQKRAEIGLMKALGAKEGQVAWVFLFQGMIVGVLGVTIGLVMAHFTILFRNDMAGWLGQQFGVDFFAEEVYRVDGGLPAKQTVKDFVIISLGSFLLCIVASLIPALIAAAMQPAKALRSD